MGGEKKFSDISYSNILIITTLRIMLECLLFLFVYLFVFLALQPIVFVFFTAR